jgi:hypothetical protein
MLIEETMRINPVFKHTSTPSIVVPPYYLQMARHWKMGAQSSDAIRRRLIQRGLSMEQTFKVIELLDQEEYEAGGFLVGRSGYRGRLRMPIRGGRMFMGFVPGTPNPQARTWWMGYTALLVMGVLSLLFNQVLVTPVMRCDLVGYGFVAMGLMGLFMYALNVVFARFF